MEIGKLKASDLEKLVFKNIKHRRSEILTDPKIGGDCAVLDFGDKVAYISSDPITGASEELGKLAVNINCNDIATAGIEPVGLMLTILAPEGTSASDIERVVADAHTEAKKLNVSIMGGHTEITKVVNRMVVSVTAIGIGKKEDYTKRGKVIPGDILILTKGAGIEGTGIIAYEKSEEIRENLGEHTLRNAKTMLDKISVVREGIIASPHVKGMHDVTEGGVLGAVWEVSEFYSLGSEIYREKIKIAECTKDICKYFKIDPLKLISSGSMLLAADPIKGAEIVEILKKEGIESHIIGKFTEENSKSIISEGFSEEISEPESDELYKVV
ncbi:AIR synthase family protein [uncultured Ilyobacter sp.]|uniref:AIR synthase family protein n=1 Tax=uncultured Ilyobacter sp. TaxID=544433 RepID=UPI0029C758B2|nr:AIR synthase family protein [uncultured Ilyobacter sp.]